MKRWEPSLPALLTFGPFMMLSGAGRTVYGFGSTGALMMAIGGVGLLMKLRRLEAPLDELDRKG